MKLKLLVLLFGCTHGQRIIIMSVVEASTFEGMEDIVRESSVMKPLKTSNVTASYSKQLVTHALIQHTAYFYMLPMKICKHTHARARARAHTTREEKNNNKKNASKQSQKPSDWRSEWVMWREAPTLRYITHSHNPYDFVVAKNKRRIPFSSPKTSILSTYTAAAAAMTKATAAAPPPPIQHTLTVPSPSAYVLYIAEKRSE